MRSIDVHGIPQLESLEVDHFNGGNADDDSDEVVQRAHRLTITGLPEVTHVKSLKMNGVFFNAAQISDIAKLHTLESLNLSSTNLGDEGFSRVASLPKLTSANVSAAGLDDESIVAAARLPRGAALDLTNSPINQTAIDKLKKRRPDLVVLSDSSYHQNSLAELHKQLALQSVATGVHLVRGTLGDRDMPELLAGGAGSATSISIRLISRMPGPRLSAPDAPRIAVAAKHAHFGCWLGELHGLRHCAN